MSYCSGVLYFLVPSSFSLEPLICLLYAEKMKLREMMTNFLDHQYLSETDYSKQIFL